MFDKNDLPFVFNLHDQAVGVPLDIEYRVRIDKIRAGVGLSNLYEVLPLGVARYLVPLRQWAF